MNKTTFFEISITLIAKSFKGFLFVLLLVPFGMYAQFPPGTNISSLTAPFACNGNGYVVSGGNINVEASVLSVINPSVPGTSTTLFPFSGITVNAMGFNSNLSLAYGLIIGRAGSGGTPAGTGSADFYNIIIFDSAGNIVNLGKPTQSTAPGSGPIIPWLSTNIFNATGEFDSNTNTYYFMGRTGTSGAWNHIVKLNVNTMTYTTTAFTGPVLPVSSSQTSDLAFSSYDNKLYGISTTQGLVSLNPVTGAYSLITTTVPSGVNLLLGAGGAWSDATGKLYFYQNNPSNPSEIRFLSYDPSTNTLLDLGPSLPFSQFDATACIPPVLTKGVSPSPTVAAGTSMTYTFTITNPSSSQTVVSFSDILSNPNVTFNTASLSPATPGGATVTTFSPTTLNLSNITVPAKIVGDPASGILTFTAQVNIASNASSGDYSNIASITVGSTTLTSNPTNDPTGGGTTVTIIAQINAANDAFVLGNGGTSTTIVANDLLAGSTPVIGTNPGEITITPNPNGTNPSGFIIDPNTGLVSVAPGTPNATYVLEYQICENGITPVNCDIATITITIADNDLDGVVDSVDLDDDNDGILDSVECGNSADRFLRFRVIYTDNNAGSDGRIQWNIGGTFVDVPSTSIYSVPSVNSNAVPTALNQGFVYEREWATDASAVCSSIAPFNSNWNTATGTWLPGTTPSSEGVVAASFIGFDDGVNITNLSGGTSAFCAGGLVAGGYESGQQDGWLLIPAGVNTFTLRLGSTDSFEYHGVLLGTSSSNLNFVGGYYGGSTSDIVVNVPSGLPIALPLTAGQCDTDGDGKPNYLDLDSDDDGCSDANEAYGSSTADSNGDGTYGGVVVVYDSGNPTNPSGVAADGTVNAATYPGTNANVTIATQVAITTQPTNQSTNSGANAIFTVTATGTNTTTFAAGTPNYTIPPATDANAGLTYQWQESTNGGTTWANVTNGGIYSGATTATLTLTGVTVTQNGYDYRVIVRHSTIICENISNFVNLIVANAPVVTIADASITEGGNLSFPVTLSNPSATDITVTLGFTNVTTANGDYTTVPVTVTFLAGATTATATVPTTADTIDELDETFTVAITSTTGTVGSTTDTATGTINDDDNAPTVASISPSNAVEGDAVVFNFTLSNPSAVDTTYTFTLTNGTAGSADYTTTSITVTVPAGATTGTVSVPTTADTIDEADESFSISSGAVSSTGTINDNDDAPVVTIADASITEGGNLSFPVTLSNPSATDITVTLGFTNVTTANGDYTTVPVTVTFLAGATTATATVPTTADTIDELDETFTVAITSTTGTVGSTTDTATGTINDDDNAPTVASISPSNAVEGDAVVFNFTLSNPSAVDTTYTFTLTNGTAGSADYTTTSITVTVPAGATTGTVSVPTTADTIDEADESFSISSGAVSSTGTINDNDDAPVVTIADASITEGGNLSFPVTLSNPSATDITVTLGFTNVTTANGDYTTVPVTVTFLAGATTATATVPTTADTIDELDETFTVAITSTTGTVGSTTDTATGTINDDDNAPTVASISPSNAVEGDAVVFNFTLSNPSAVDTTYTFTLTNGTAGSADYTTTSITVTVPAGATTGTVSVPTTADTIDEADESFSISSGAVSSTGTINDNDDAPVVTIADASITEGGNLSFPVTLSNPSATDITVTLGFTNVTTANGDYTTVPVTVTFLAGATTATATVPTTADTIDELDETFTVAITSTTGTVGSTTDTATGTINDDDNAPTVASISPSNAVEGDAVVFNFTLSNPSAVDTTYTFTLTNGTAGSADYTTTSITVTVPAGATTGTVSVPTTADTIDEADESFSISSGAVSSTGTINDNDDAPVVTIADASITEGGNLSFPVTLSNPSATDITVTLGFTNVTTANGDYTTVPVTVTFLAGATTATATVPTTADTIDELDETFTVAITSTTGTVGSTTDTATGTINDDDNAPTVASISPSNAIEGDAVVFNFTLSNPSAVDTTYTFTLTNGTAGSADYTTTSVTVTVPAGATTGTVSVPTTADTIDEADESFSISSGAVSSTGTINDNDDAPVVTIADASITEGGNLSFPVTLSNPSATDITVTLGFTNVTTANGDYTTVPVTVTFLAGATTATATVPTTADTIDELDETFTVAITSTTGTVGSTTDTATGTINDDDNAPTVASISPSNAIEGDAVVFNFTLSNPSAVDTTYTFTLTNGTAGSADYTTTSVTVTVPAGATTGTVSVPTTADTIDEADESFSISSGAVSSTGTINDNDDAPVVTIADASITEGGNLSFPVTLSNPSATDITVTLGFTNVTTANGDYTTVPVTVTFLAGATTATATVPTTADTIDELDETFTVAITSTTGTVGSTTDTATGTINDDDNAPTVASISPSNAVEGDAVVFNFTLSNPSAVDTTYTFTLTNGTAGSADYTTTSITVTVPAGATTGTVSVPTTADTIDEADESFSISSGAVSSTGTINDNDDAPVVTIADASITEGGNLSFPVTLSNPSATDITVTLGFTNVTTANGDYTTVPVTVTFLAGATTATATVPTTADTIDELDETFTVAITSTTGTVGSTTDTATGTINDDDNAPTVASISPSNAVEGDAVVFNFTLSNPSAVDTTYTFTLINGTAGSADYTTTSITVTVPAGATTGTVSVPTTADTIDEADESFSISSGAVSSTGTINDNDDAPVVTIADASITEGGNLSFPVTLSNPSATDITVTLGFTNVTTANGDYTTVPVTVTFLAGATTATATVPTTADTIDELDETFTVAITSTTGTVGSTTDTATGTINDDDNAPTVASISPSNAVEGDAVVFNFTLSNPSAVDTTYTFTLINGTAGSADYTTTSVTVTVPAGATTGTVSVPTTADTIDEADESFSISSGAVSSTGTINDNDDAPVVTIADASITEGGNLSFPVTLSNPSATDITVTLGFTNVTTANGDYTTVPVTVTFLAGATTATATVPTTADTIDELDETFTVAITSTTGTVGSTTDTATGTINDDDNAPTVASISPSNAVEGDAVVFNFTLSNPSAVDTTYTFTLTNGTAGSADYTTTSITVTVPAGATTGTVSVPTTADTIDEADESFSISSGAVSSTGTINDNDDAPVVTIADASITEGGNLSFPVTLSNPSATDITVTLGFTNVTTANGDYTTVPVTVTFLAGATTATATVPTTADTIDELDETFTVAITSTTGTVGSTTDTATGTINDDDNAPTVASISPSNAVEGDAVVFNFTLSNPSAVDTTYTFTLTNGTAGSADYTTTSITVTVPAGATTGTVSVPTTADTIDEADESFSISSGAVSSTGIILDDDVTPIATNDVVTTDEDTPVTINVTTNDTDGDGTIDVTTVDLDPATAGIQTTFTVAGEGTYTVNNLGVITFTPVLNYNGTTTAITYTVNDNSGIVSNSATLTIIVNAVTDALVANNDPLPSTGGNVTANDTLNGVPVTTANTDVTPVTNGPLSIDADGNLTVAPNTPNGTYTITYEICEAGAVPVNCTTATVTVNYVNPLVASNDTFTAAGGNVLGNDSVNGSPATMTNTVVTPVTSGPLSIDAAGNVTVAPNTPSGTYTIVYEICQTGMTPANCTTATVTVVVNNIIVANNNTFSPTGGNVTANDTVNGVPATPANTDVTPVTSGPLSIDANGNLTVAPNTPSGTYNIEYEICEVGASPSNCTRAIATVVINNLIVANNVTIPSTGGNVTANDTINGVPVTTANTDVTPVTSGPLSIDANGNLTVAPNTPSGTYTITYQICEVGATPANCTTATATVVVNNVLVALNDTLPATGGNVLANDTINGVPATAANTDVTPVTNGPLSIDANGNLTVSPNTIAGTYSITYQVCETGSNPLVCTTATVTVVVNETPDIAIVKTAVFNDENGDGFAQAGETITYSFAVSNTGNTPLNNVTVTDVLPGLILSGNSIPLLPVGATNNTAYQGVYRLKQSDINLGSVTNQATATGVTPLGVVVSDLSDDSSALSDRPTVLAIQGCVIEVFNAVAPNGNGDNKVFRIRGLECYSDNTVEIYNRWGVLVFERAGYNNDDRAFRGVSEGRVTIKQSEELPEGTYYYILRYKDSAATSFEKAGYLYINR